MTEEDREALYTFELTVQVDVIARTAQEAREMLMSTSNWSEWVVQDEEATSVLAAPKLINVQVEEP